MPALHNPLIPCLKLANPLYSPTSRWERTNSWNLIMFEMLTERLNGVFKQLRSRGRLSESNIDDGHARSAPGIARGRRQLQGRPLIHRTGPRTRHRSGSPQKHHARAASRQSCPRRIDRAHGQPKCRLATRRIAPLSRHDGRPPGIGQNDLGGKIGSIIGISKQKTLCS